MHRPPWNPFGNTRRRKTEFALDRRRLRSPAIDAQPAQSPLDALARGLVAIGEKYRARPNLRVL